MKKKILLISLFVFAIIIIPKNVLAKEFSGGSGTKKNPYIISNLTDLKNISNYCGSQYKGKYFKVVVKGNKLDASSVGAFEPICELNYGANEEEVFENAFYGNFDGNNVEIDNLKILTNKYAAGLFGATNGATISNVIIGKNSSINMHGQSSEHELGLAGAIVGEAWNTTITNVTNYADVTSTYNGAGGIVGRLIQDSKITNAKNYGNIKSGQNSDGKSHSGGIVGYASDNITIENVENSGSITGDGSRIGGIAGSLQGYLENRNETGSSSIKNASNKGEIKAGKNNDGESITGGIVGSTIHNITIENVYNTGSVVGEGRRVGGIIGSLQLENNRVSNIANYNQDIKGTDHVGLLIGIITDNSSATVKNTYTLKESTDLPGLGYYNKDEGLVSIENMMGYTSEQLKDQNTYAGFDFDNTWKMGSEYAVLKNDGNTTTSSSTTKPNGNAVIIKFNNKIIDVDNYIYNDRTFVDIYDFCEQSQLCSVSIDKDDSNKYLIQKNIDMAGGAVNSSIKNDKTVYSYIVKHIKGTKEFTPYLIIGGKTLVNDLTINQIGDVASCPDEKEHPCNENKLYVPLRFLTQSFGLRVEWDGETYTVNISDTLVKTFIQKYDVVTTNKKKCTNSSCVVEKIEDYDNNNVTTTLEKGTYYLEVIDRANNKLKDFDRMYSFYSKDDNNNKNETKAKFTKGIFTIEKNKLTISSPKNSDKTIARNIAQVIVYEIKETDKDYLESNNNVGAYPIVINNQFACSNCSK